MHKTPYVYATIPRLQASPTKILRGVLQEEKLIQFQVI